VDFDTALTSFVEAAAIVRPDNSAYPTALKPLKQGGSYSAGMPTKAKVRGGDPGEPIGEDEIEEGSGNWKRQARLLKSMNKGRPDDEVPDLMMAHARKAGTGQIRASDRTSDTPAGQVTRGTVHRLSRGMKTKGRESDFPEMNEPDWAKIRAGLTKDRLKQSQNSGVENEDTTQPIWALLAEARKRRGWFTPTRPKKRR
jgi:hypothetical protein